MNAWGVRALPHFVYRLFDEQGALLYVGMTRDFDTRLIAHLSTTMPLDSRVSGWRDIHARYHHHSLDAYPNWVEAKAAERATIAAEEPEVNWQFNPKGRALAKATGRTAVTA